MTEPSRGGSDWRAAVPVGTETVQTGPLRVTWRTPLVVARLPVEGSGRWPVGWVFEVEPAVGAGVIGPVAGGVDASAHDGVLVPTMAAKDRARGPQTG